MDIYRKTLFPALAGLLWAVFLALDLTGLWGSTWIKFTALALPGMWFFYLPSQVLIVLSQETGDTHEKAL